MANILSFFNRIESPSRNYFFLACGAALTGTVSVKLFKFMKSKIVIDKAVVVITGCDSGLGYSMAYHCHELGFHVFAGVLNLHSAGSKSLESLEKDKGRMSIIKLNLTDISDINKSSSIVTEFLNNHSDYHLHAVINNAGIMIFGEFEWLTDEMIVQHVNVNILGTLRFTKSFLPLLRKYKGRIINVSSHCALAALPGLSVYAASKSAVQAWNDSIRVEYGKYGVKVISFIPGSFVLQSSILSNQVLFGNQMKSAMKEECAKFYGDYFTQYQNYVGSFSSIDRPLQRLQDNNLYKCITDALVSKNPSYSYTNSPFRYTFYHFLFHISPISIRDRLVEYFVSMPKYEKTLSQ